MARRSVLLFVLALLAASGRRADAGYDQRMRACERPGQCPPEVDKLYHGHPADEPTVELITMGIGSLIWERHGHIALCLRYADETRDICYNYGIGDFLHPGGMAWGFFRGTDSFWAGEQDVRQLAMTYMGRDRTVWAQPIPLTSEQKKEVIEKLETDTDPLEGRPPRPGRHPGKNLYYAYDHFQDNCTTRIRDILDHATHGALSSMSEESDGKTFRDLARDGFYGMRLPLLITDIAMGRITDRVPSYWERMFLPQYLREAAAKRWNIQPIVLYERHAGHKGNEDANGNGTPDIHEDANGNGIPDFEEDTEHDSGRFLFALFIIAITSPVVLTRWLGRFQRIGLAIAIIPPVILGTVLWFLAIISPLPYVQWQETCLLLGPFDLALLLLNPVRRRKYARFRVSMLGAILVLHIVGILTQPLVAPLLWPLIPNAVVGYWKSSWSRNKAAAKQERDEEKAEKKAIEKVTSASMSTKDKLDAKSKAGAKKKKR